MTSVRLLAIGFALAAISAPAFAASAPNLPGAPLSPGAPLEPEAPMLLPEGVVERPVLPFEDWTLQAADKTVVLKPASEAGKAEPPILTAEMLRAKSGWEVGANDQMIDYIEARLLTIVPQDIQEYFDLYLYISRANKGPYAQRLYVFERDPAFGFSPFAQWLVSTGREAMEIAPGARKEMFTGTPDGMFKLDHGRFFKTRISYQWKTQMPWSMFLDADFNRVRTGYALHGAASPEDIAMLGQRASAGCIRLHPEQAQELFYKIRNDTWGKVPVFPYDRIADSTNTQGRAKRNKQGNIVLTRGYRVLLVIENFEGGPEGVPTDSVISAAY